MKVLKVKFYSDPGHGWAAVKRQVLYQLGITDKITMYSYQKGGTVYLEEDCDLTTFLNAVKARGDFVELQEKHTEGRSPIRNYSRYMA